MKYAVIGGIGSGKSSVTKYLSSLGKLTFDCDVIAQGIMEEENFVSCVAQYFPNVVCDGIVNRKLLGNIVFEDEKKLALLNSLVHPLVKKRLQNFAKLCGESDLFVEVSVFIGSGLENFFDKIICVVADKDIRIRRVMQRNGYDKQHCESIIYNQPNQQKLVEISDFIVNNNSDINNIQNQVDDILKKL